MITKGTDKLINSLAVDWLIYDTFHAYDDTQGTWPPAYPYYLTLGRSVVASNDIHSGCLSSCLKSIEGHTLVFCLIIPGGQHCWFSKKSDHLESKWVTVT